MNNIKKFLFLIISTLVFFSQAPLVLATKTQGDFNLSNRQSDEDNRDQEDNLKLDWQSQLNAKQCKAEDKPVINVSERVKNDVDSGLAGNWAIDNYTRHIKVWSTGENSWCATVKYEGIANAVAGQTGPGGTGTIGSNVKAEMEGGYRATFTGTLKGSPLWPTHGSVGTVDYGCNISGSSCTYLSWTGQYFDSVGAFDQPWWGWIYNADENGTWINAVSGNLGNIL